VGNPSNSIKQLEKEISNRISPPLTCTIEPHSTGGKNVIRVLVPRGEDPPYAVDDNKIYVRAEGETGLAVRDEIVGLVKGAARIEAVAEDQPISLVPKMEDNQKVEKDKIAQPPRTGVEVVNVVERKGVKYYTVMDLRNSNTVKNVTEKSARRLWHYAITNFSKLSPDVRKIKTEWKDNRGIIRKYKQGKRQIFDLVERDGGKYRTYFGVTEDGVHGSWRRLVGLEGDD
jgi:hypothetical protein